MFDPEPAATCGRHLPTALPAFHFLTRPWHEMQEHRVPPMFLRFYRGLLLFRPTVSADLGLIQLFFVYAGRDSPYRGGLVR